MAVYNGQLIVGGEFTSIDGVACNAIAQWDGESWSALGTGMGSYGSVYALAVYNGDLIAGGYFTTAGGVTCNSIAKWNGQTWSPLAGGMLGGGSVYALTVYNGELVAGGYFTRAGGVACRNIARWDGTSWSDVDIDMDSGVYALTVYNGDLIAGGSFTLAGDSPGDYVARWNSADGWSSLDSGMDSNVWCLSVYNDPVTQEDRLIVGGDFALAGDQTCKGIACWTETDGWGPVGEGLGGGLGSGDEEPRPSVYSLGLWDGKLIAGGYFKTLGDPAGLRIAAWDGMSWSRLGRGTDDCVRALVAYDDDLIAGGDFLMAAGVSAERLARWNPAFDGCYELSGTPYAKYVISKTDGDINNLRVTKYAGESATARYDYTYTPASSAWALTTSDGSGNSGRSESLEKVDLGDGNRQETTTVSNGDGATLVYKERRTYATVVRDGASIEAMTSKQVDPDGANLTTTWTYYTTGDDDEDHARSGRIKSVQNPDGSWVMYDYDWQGFPTVENHSWLDDAMPTAADDAGAGRRTVYDYMPVDDNDSWEYPSRPRTVTEYIHETVVARTFHVYSWSEYFGRMEIVQQDTDVAGGSGYGDPRNLTTTTVYYGWDVPTPDRVFMVQYPDGRLDTYDYAIGGYDQVMHAFDPAGTGCMQTTITHGTVESPDGVALKTTQEVRLVDDLGPVWLEETKVCTGPGTFESLGATWYEYDERGHRTASHYPNGTQLLSSWGCCNMDWQTAVDGTTTHFDRYDALGHVLQKTVDGISGSGNAGDAGYRPDITTTYTYDGMGREIAATVGGTLTTETAYRPDGRIDHTTDTSGLQTGYTYPGAHTRTVTRPGEATETTEYYLDGQTKSVTRGGAVVQYCTYEVDGNNLVARTYAGDYGSPAWSETVTDGLGRTVAERRSGYQGSTVPTTYAYCTDNSPGNSKGKVQKITPSVGAPMLYEYDDLGQVYRTGLDADGDGSLMVASTDHITETTTQFEQEAGAWWRTTTTTVYDRDDDSHGISTTQRECVGGGGTGVVSLTRSIDAYDNETMTAVMVNAASKTVTQTVTYPDSDEDEVTITRNGLVDSVTSKTGLLTQYAYDALGRQAGVTDSRQNTTVTTYYEDGLGAKGKVHYVTDAGGWQTAYTYDTNGRLSSVQDPAGKKQYFEYNDRGQQIHTWGDTTYPVAYDYDDFGCMLTMKTYCDPASTYTWTGATWPAPADTDAEITQWVYDPSSGLLTSKVYSDSKHVDYTYTSDGRVLTRMWARGVVTTYEYEGPANALHTVSYSDGTPGLTYSYDRLGRPKTVTQTKAGTGGWTHSTVFSYNGSLQLESEAITGDIYSRTITRNYQQADTGEVPGRAGGLSIGTEYNTAYGYDSFGRLNKVTGPGLPAGGVAYTRLANSELIEYANYQDESATTLAGWHKAYEPTRDLLDYVENTAGATSLSKYDYTNDNLGRRTAVVHTGTAFASTYNTQWGYNDRSELTNADRYSGTTPGTHTASPFSFGYDYDSIGNRKTYQQDGATPATAYTANNLNQYQKITPSNELLSYDDDGNLTGTGATSPSDFNVDGYVDLADYAFFAGCVSGPVATPTQTGWQQADLNNDGHVDLKDFLIFQKAFNGSNLPPRDYTGPAPMVYTWDGENRLTSVEPQAAAEGVKKVTFDYDYLGRRMRKQVYTYSSGAWTQERDQRFVYDGWSVIEVLSADGTVTQKYTWGLDLSEGLQGTGGVGGLLAVVETGGTNAGSYWFLYDGNGNVGQVIRASDQGLAARYEYDPYGNAVSLTPGTGEAYTDTNSFRFSTKWFDGESALYYYGYRYYSPQLGRWVNRDPLEEEGGLNSVAYCADSPVDATDSLGLKWTTTRSRNESWAIARPEESSDTFVTLATQLRLEYEERTKWLKGPGPAFDFVEDAAEAQIGCEYKVPNVVVVYTSKKSSWDRIFSNTMANEFREMAYRSGINYRNKNYKVEMHLYSSSDPEFKRLWQTDGIVAFAFGGHGADDGQGGTWFGYKPEPGDETAVGPDEVKLPYKLQAVGAYSCGSANAIYASTKPQWPNRPAPTMKWRDLVSESGTYIGYYGAVNWVNVIWNEQAINPGDIPE